MDNEKLEAENNRLRDINFDLRSVISGHNYAISKLSKRLRKVEEDLKELKLKSQR